MRKILQITLLLCSLILSGLAGDAYAQTENRQKSRLDIRPKSAVVAPKIKFSLLRIQAPATGLDRQLSIRSNSDFINRYFRTALFNTNSPKIPVKLVAETTLPALNSEKNTEDKGNEDKLFANDKIVVSTIFPNPADEVAEIEYSINNSATDAKLTFYNLLGIEVKEVDLPKDDHKVRVTTREWNSGMYLYQLSVEGKSLATKKMFIKH